MDPFETLLETLKELGASVYRPALQRLTTAEALALLNLATTNRSEEALDLLRARMSGEELAAEKEVIAASLETRLGDETRLRLSSNETANLILRTLLGSLFAAI